MTDYSVAQCANDRHAARRTMWICAAACLSAAFLLSGCGDEPGESYRLDLKAVQEIAPEAVGYRQSQLVKLPFADATAIATGNGEYGLAVAGERQVVLLDPDDFAVVAESALPGRALAVALADQRIYVALADRIVLWQPAAGGPPAAWGELPGKASLCGIAATSDQVWAAESAGGVVWAFAADGTFLHAIGGRKNPAAPPHFILPSRTFDLAAAPDGSVWVVNPGRHLLENYRRDGSLIGSWGTGGADLERFSGCCNPSHIALFADHRFATVEKGLDRIKEYDQTGTFVTVIAGPDRLEGTGAALDIATLPDGRVAVLDPAAGIIRIFSPNPSQPNGAGE